MTQRIVIIGAGIAGVSLAHRLALRGHGDIVLVDEREPLTLTSDKGTWGYRNWWPGPDDTMCRFVSRSIDLLEELAEESGDAFGMNRRGYVFATGDEARIANLREVANTVASFGMGPVREHDGRSSSDPYAHAPMNEWRGQPIGADLLLGSDQVRAAFPFVTADAIAALHIRRAGTLDAAALGRWLLERAITRGLRLVRDRAVAVRTEGGRVREVGLASGENIGCDVLVLAAGPLMPQAARMLGVELPLFHELHGKLTLRDPVHAVPRGAPFTIWLDPVTLPWTAEERADLERASSMRALLEPFPGGVHVRPVDKETGTEVYCIWTYDDHPVPYVWPPVFDPWYAEICIRGIARLVPAMSAYFGRGSDGWVDGGYYCKTSDNRPLIGPLPIEGAFSLGGLSGYGLMASQAAAELLALHLEGAKLPAYASALLPSRYDDPAYRARAEEIGGRAGQL